MAARHHHVLPVNSRQFGHHGLVAHSGLPHFHQCFSAQRQVHVNARTELDETHVFVDATFLVFNGIGHDTPRHGTGYLPYQHLVPLWGLDDHSRAFILDAGLGQPSLVEVAVVVYHLLDNAFHGEPVRPPLQSPPPCHQRLPPLSLPRRRGTGGAGSGRN